uniref:Putative LOC102225960 [Xiphosphorus maculatus] n=1 Tax=Lepeophtheirus salmonis TaxID=72036 RepID=A0A0K2U131_LEPSM
MQIADLLAFVNKQMILIFKTNDLLRTIEHNLGTSNSMSSLIQMSRSCLRCMNDFKLKKEKKRIQRLMLHLRGNWDQCRISIYQIYLWFYLQFFYKQNQIEQQ